MNQEIEIEWKNLLTENEFSVLCSAFKVKPEDFWLQHNHYFDTENGMLKKAGSALRIREKQQHRQLTLKQPHPQGLLETHQEISAEDTARAIDHSLLPDGDVMNQLQNNGLRPHGLHYLGTLTTKRAEVQFRGGILVFDHSFYLNHEDYELEYECTDVNGKQTFHELLKEYKIPVRATENKIKRFFDKKNAK
ncbi:MAG TPA: CYTH domain-containing protein [Bacillales bacterium]|nr:CYTH domain-containing protein [Bacillales bacterium]